MSLWKYGDLLTLRPTTLPRAIDQFRNAFGVSANNNLIRGALNIVRRYVVYMNRIDLQWLDLSSSFEKSQDPRKQQRTMTDTWRLRTLEQVKEKRKQLFGPMADKKFSIDWTVTSANETWTECEAEEGEGKEFARKTTKAPVAWQCPFWIDVRTNEEAFDVAAYIETRFRKDEHLFLWLERYVSRAWLLFANETKEECAGVVLLPAIRCSVFLTPNPDIPRPHRDVESSRARTATSTSFAANKCMKLVSKVLEEPTCCGSEEDGESCGAKNACAATWDAFHKLCYAKWNNVKLTKQVKFRLCNWMIHYVFSKRHLFDTQEIIQRYGSHNYQIEVEMISERNETYTKSMDKLFRVHHKCVTERKDELGVTVTHRFLDQFILQFEQMCAGQTMRPITSRAELEHHLKAMGIPIVVDKTTSLVKLDQIECAKSDMSPDVILYGFVDGQLILQTVADISGMTIEPYRITHKDKDIDTFETVLATDKGALKNTASG